MAADEDNDTIAVLFDFGDGNVAWADVSVTSEMTASQATVQAADQLGLELNTVSGFVSGIGGYTDPSSVHWWHFWTWDSTTQKWVTSMDTSPSIKASSVEAVAWSFAQDISPFPNLVPPYPPLATPEHRYPWTSFRHDNLNSGYQPVYDPTNLTLKWQRDLGNGAIEGAIAVVDGYSYVVTSGVQNETTWAYDTNSTVFCLDSTGATVWKADIGKGYQVAAPLVYGGKVIVASADGKVYAFDAKDGSTQWTYDTGTALTYGIASSPVVYDGNIIFAATNGVLYTLHDNGTEALPNQSLASSVYSSTAAARDGVVYIGTEDGDLVATNTSDGTQLWSVALGSKVRGSPLLLDDSIVVTYLNYTGSYPTAGGLACVSYDGALLWQTELGITPASAALTENGIVVMNYTGMIKVSFNGAVLWYTDLGTSFGGAAPTSVNGTIFAVTNEENSRLVAVNETGEVIFQQVLSPAQYALSAPTVSDGMVFMSTDSGYVYAYELTNDIGEQKSTDGSIMPAMGLIVALVVVVAVVVVATRKKR